MLMKLYLKTLNTFVRRILSSANTMTILTISMLLVALFTAKKTQADSLILDIGYQNEQTAIDAKIHAKHNVFVSSNVHAKEGTPNLGVGYGHKISDFLLVGSYYENKDIELYASFKPSTMLYQVGVGLIKAKETDRLQVEYTYFLEKSFGIVTKYDTEKGFFIGIRKWL